MLRWSDGTEAEVHAGITGPDGQWLVVTGDAGEVELRDAPYTSWKDDATELWVSDGTGTERVPVPAVDAYRVMVEEVSSVLSRRPGLGAAAGGVAADRGGARRGVRQRALGRRAGPRSLSAWSC